MSITRLAHGIRSSYLLRHLMPGGIPAAMWPSYYGPSVGPTHSGIRHTLKARRPPIRLLNVARHEMIFCNSSLGAVSGPLCSTTQLTSPYCQAMAVWSLCQCQEQLHSSLRPTAFDPFSHQISYITSPAHGQGGVVRDSELCWSLGTPSQGESRPTALPMSS